MNCRTCDALNEAGATRCRVCGRPPDAPMVHQRDDGAGTVAAPAVLAPPPVKSAPIGPQRSPWATLSLSAGLLAWTALLVLAFVLAIAGDQRLLPAGVLTAIAIFGSGVAIFDGHRALRSIAGAGGTLIGNKLAYWGLGLGYVAATVMGLGLLGVCVFVAVSAALTA